MRYAVLVAFLASLNILGAPEDLSVKTIQRMTKSIVPIVCGYNEQNEFQLVGIAGSGFFVDRFGRFITASHVLDSWTQLSEKRHTCFPAIYIPKQLPPSCTAAICANPDCPARYFELIRSIAVCGFCGASSL